MKKFLVLLLALSLSFTIAACGGTDEERNAPVIEGADDVTIYTEAEFDPMEGITATDHDGNDITDDVTMTGTVDTSKSGSNYLRYRVEDSEGLSSEATRYVTVEVDPDSVGDEMVPNGDFSMGTEFWNLTTGNEGGYGSMEEVDGELKVIVEAPSWNIWEPRLENSGITFEKDQAYEVTFDARAEEVRSVNVQVGEILSGAPWFTDFKPGQSEIHELTTEMQTYSFQFEMGLDTNENGSLLFEMGTIDADDPDNLATTIYYDNITIEPIDEFDDVTPPVISGVDDATIEVGKDFDPLEGVSVTDNVDGEITLDASHVDGEVDTDTEGTYTLTYTVSDEAGNIAEETRVITVVALVFNETDMITNSDFSEPLDTEDPEWTLWQADWDPNDSPMSDGSISVEDGKLKLEVNDLGTWDPVHWLLQASHQVNYEKGHTYKVEFTASAEAARDITVAAGFTDGNDDFLGSSQSFQITETADVYEFIFTVEDDSGEFNDELKFEFGHSDETVYIHDVDLLVLDQGPLQDNGTFDDSGWYVWSQDWGSAPQIEDGIIDEQYVITSSDSLGDANWAIQFVQEGLTLESGQSYRVSYDAFADHARDINFKVIDAVGAEIEDTATLSTTMDTYTFDFTYDGTEDTGKISIELGEIGDDAQPGTTTFDNISIVKLDDSEDVVDGSDLVTNGTFDEIIHWETWVQDWEEEPTTSMEVIDGELVYTYDGLGDENWGIQLFQNDREFVVGQTYTLEFDMKADHERDINAKIISDNEIVNVVSLTTDMTHYEYTFVYDGPSELGNINFEFGNIEGANSSGVITMDNVILYRNFNPQD